MRLRFAGSAATLGIASNFAKLLPRVPRAVPPHARGPYPAAAAPLSRLPDKEETSEGGKFHRLDYAMRFVQMFLPAFLQNWTSSKNMWTKANEGCNNSGGVLKESPRPKLPD